MYDYSQFLQLNKNVIQNLVLANFSGTKICGLSAAFVQLQGVCLYTGLAVMLGCLLAGASVQLRGPQGVWMYAGLAVMVVCLLAGASVQLRGPQGVWMYAGQAVMVVCLLAGASVQLRGPQGLGLYTGLAVMVVCLLAGASVHLRGPQGVWLELFTTVLDMLATLIHSTLVSDSQIEKEDSRKHYQNLMKKLKKGLQVAEKQRVSPWDLLEGHKNPAPLSWAWFGAVRMERKPLWYEDTHRLLKYHTHSLLRPVSYFLDPPPLPVEDLDPPQEKSVSNFFLNTFPGPSDESLVPSGTCQLGAAV
uniref:(California timema) hypothetical protein n=1 Tax=Timema californicum TaxID=61474 RepID=A0A7R9JIM5_TIMCA|nr:unnamed protein product [Timema californicum]